MSSGCGSASYISISTQVSRFSDYGPRVEPSAATLARKMRRLDGRRADALTVQGPVREEDVAGLQNRVFSLERYSASCTMGQTWAQSLFAALELDSMLTTSSMPVSSSLLCASIYTASSSVNLESMRLSFHFPLAAACHAFRVFTLWKTFV